MRAEVALLIVQLRSRYAPIRMGAAFALADFLRHPGVESTLREAEALETGAGDARVAKVIRLVLNGWSIDDVIGVDVPDEQPTMPDCAQALRPSEHPKGKP